MLACARPDRGAPSPPSPGAASETTVSATTAPELGPFEPQAVASALAYSESTSGHAVLILHRGQQVAAAFHNDWDAEQPHGLASGTKSFWGPVVVAAIEDGLLRGFDEVAADTIVEWKEDPQRSSITVRQLLAFTSGLEPDLGVTVDTVFQSDMFGLSVAAPARADAGTRWAYSDSSHSALGALLERKLAASDSNLETYLQTRLLTPLGIEAPSWQRDGAGHLLMPSGARLTPEQWAGFGELIRTGGQAPNGTQLLDSKLLAECFQPSSAPPAGQFYGLGWWLTTYTSYKYDLPEDMVIAGGSGGQMLFVIPSAETTIVRFGTGEDFVDGEFLCRLFHGAPMDECPQRGGEQG